MLKAFTPKKASGTSNEVLHEAEAFSQHEDEDDVLATPTGDELSLTTSKEENAVSIGAAENARVSITRTIMLVVLITVATSLSLVIYFVARESEHKAFHDSFEVVANKLAEEFEGGGVRRLTAIESFAAQISSYARSTNSTWPNVALPDYELHGRYIMDLSDMLGLVLFPIVTKENRESYERFTVENQGWIEEGLEFQGIPEEDWDYETIAVVQAGFNQDSISPTIPEKIFALNGTEPVVETGDGPYVPFWQMYPAVPVKSIVNYNPLTHPTRMIPIQTALDYGNPMIGDSWDYRESENVATTARRSMLNLWILHAGFDASTYVDGPVSDLYIPIHDNVYDENATLVALLSATIYWQVYFEDLLSDNDRGIIVILENSCGQPYTFQVDGSQASYIGQGDFHEAEYTHMGVETEYGSFSGTPEDVNDIPDGKCLYHIRAYPTDEFAGRFMTSAPRRFSLSLAATFALTCLIFLLYDKFVQVRQRTVMDSAVKSGAVVNSLFPKEVRDRLYEKQESPEDKTGKRTNASGFLTSTVPEVDKPSDLEADCMAIADLYPECTVCFLDVVGFTEWSSEREPSHVFKLLETLYKSFDKSAKRLGVFKVETIGDCYVAVTGLPQPQEDHALLMAQFAADCCLKIGSVTHYLAEQLGSDTLSLNLRGGIHSGPVTAGVLRGAKARFQLFGDTVNTAARMESTGETSKVQLSEETGDLLTKAGKEEWIVPREEEVLAKGKGSLSTYWLQLSRVDRGLETVGSTSGPSQSIASYEMEQKRDRKPTYETLESIGDRS
eukprot:Nitzschia sp. Nitz4//scaffold14_size191712//186333//188797//NITZ4_001756-RA/size191712-snap-gene-0.145-mRNA-1//1//CDS//3329537026//1237//frame0